MLPVNIHVLSLHLSLLLISGHEAAGEGLVYNKTSGVPLVLTCRGDPSQGNVTFAQWAFGTTIINYNGNVNCRSRYCFNSTSLYDLVIANASRADTGEYKCYLSYNNAGEATLTRNWALTVRDLPGSTTISRSTLDMVEGRVSVVTCQSLGGYPAPNITWYKGGLLQESNVTVTPNSSGDVNAEIRFVPSYADDGASITCVAVNVLGSNNSTALLNVSYVPRNVVLTSSATSIVESSDVMMTCSAQGKPLPSISWTTPNANRSSVSLNDTVGGLSYLYVKHIQRQAAGTYVCTASNFVSQMFNLNISSNFTVDVQYQPSKPIIYTSSLSYLAGDNISLTCSVTSAGNPSALFNWTQDGLTIRAGLSTGALTLPFVRMTSSGAYVCTAYNSAGATASDMYNISVFEKPVIGRGPATIVGSLRNPVTLACSANGNPTPAITWTKNMSVDPSWNVTTLLNSTLAYTTNSLLSIVSLNQDGYGTYTCFANNSYGKDSSTIDVIAPSRPLPPSNVSIVAARWSTMVLSWAASYDGGHEQEFDVYVNSSLKYNGSNTSCTVMGLSPGNFVVYVDARNDVGKSNSSPQVVVTLLDGPQGGSLSFSTPWSLSFQADAEYCVKVKCSYADPQSNTTASNCTQMSAAEATNIKCAAAQARWCLTNQQELVCGSWSTLITTAGAQTGLPPLSQETIIIIACVVAGSVVLTFIVIAAVCYAKHRGRKKPSPSSLIRNSHDFSQSGAVHLSPASETPYATYMREQLYANPNFAGEGEDDLSHDGTQLHDHDHPNNNPQRHDYTYASVGVKRQPAPVTTGTAKGIPSYNMHDFDELDASHRDDSSSVSEPPPYHPQINGVESDTASATDSKQAKRVLYEVIV